MIMTKESDFTMPEGMKKGAELDYRFPEVFQESIPEGMRVITEFFSALCRRDPEKLATAFHFPFATFEDNRCVVVKNADEFLSNPPPSLDVKVIGPSIYDRLAGLELLQFDPVRAGLAMSYYRHGKNGRKLIHCDGVYAVTKNDGKWAIELCSTIFKPIDQIDVIHQEAVDNAHRIEREWMEGWNYSNPDLLDGALQYGLHANIAYPGPGSRFNAAREGNLARVYRSNGIANRLRITETTPETKGKYYFAEFQRGAGHGLGNWAYSRARPDARVIHQTFNKAHITGGYVRYQADGTIISETHAVGIHTKVKNRWGMAGGFGAVIIHDVSNSDRD
jgi:hypothetical protein